MKSFQLDPNFGFLKIVVPTPVNYGFLDNILQNLVRQFWRRFRRPRSIVIQSVNDYALVSTLCLRLQAELFTAASYETRSRFNYISYTPYTRSLRGGYHSVERWTRDTAL